MRKILGSLTLAVTLLMGVGIGAAVAAGPSEDSPNFNCAMHGNRMCGVLVDTTPNKPGGKVWYSLKFTSKGTAKSGSFARQDWRY